jgi:hypothetical protein
MDMPVVNMLGSRVLENENWGEMKVSKRARKRQAGAEVSVGKGVKRVIAAVFGDLILWFWVSACLGG